MESAKLVLEGVASVFVGMASTPLTTLAAVGLTFMTLALLNEFAKR